MPGVIQQNRTAIVLGIGLLLVMAAIAFLTDEQNKGDGHASSYSNLRQGGKAAYLLLAQSGYGIERWDKGPDELPKDAEGTLLIFADSESQPSEQERNAIVRFLMSGGTVLIAGSFPDSFVPNGEASMGKLRVGFAESQATAPTRLTRGGPISQDGTLYWDSGNDSHVVHYADGENHAVVVTYKVSKGEVIWWASALPLTNAGIRDRGNLDLLLNTVAGYKRILWDERYHALIPRTHSDHPIMAARWALLQLALIGVVVILTFARRSGPTVSVEGESRLSPLEFVETLGSVFDRAGSTQVAVEIAFHRFRQVAARRLGIRGLATADEIVDSMLQRGLKLDGQVAKRVRESETVISDPALTEASALLYVRSLNAAIQQLEPPRTSGAGRN